MLIDNPTLYWHDTDTISDNQIASKDVLEMKQIFKLN